MKKKLSTKILSALLFICILLIGMTGCQTFRVQQQNTGNTKYVLTTEQCGILFGVGSKKIAESTNPVYPYDQCSSCSLDKNDNLVIILNEEERKIWLDYHKEKLSQFVNTINSQSEQFVEINENHTKIVYSIDGSEDGKLSFLVNYVHLMSYCGFIVMLEGNELSEWKMDSTLFDSKNNEVIWQGVWPEERPEFH